ncbi:hypothetical protein [Hymenobacter yonginensis]|uniref:Uncharacterized protein n=1 Tax=Hymenobacter yonginensis TaxID=748197 RepID=A0ABY7PQ98_9BACT|nr:hypothetical protein [Hymenobacter yonginensis]WBO85242.1 hypothetical protein O9Z63_03135 [Hymenobacter yonginensis]
MKRAISLRAKADRKARRYAQLLADALTLGSSAAAQMNALNQLYNVDVSTQTLLVHDLQQLVTSAQLTGTLAQSTPGEEVVLFNQIPDGNGGQPLPADPLFGELVATPPVVVDPPVLQAVVKSPSPVAEKQLEPQLESVSDTEQTL